MGEIIFRFKVGFVEEIERHDGPVKFFAHFKEDEFEYLNWIDALIKFAVEV